MKIAIIGGTGDQGFGLALRLAKNYQVIIGSRRREKAQESAGRIREILSSKGIPYRDVIGMENREASREGDIVILSIPFQYTLPTIIDLREELKGKVVVSIGVPLASAVGDKPTRVVLPPQGSVAQMVQEYLKDSKVVSAFHNVSAKVLESIEEPVDCDILVCGDDEESKRKVIEVINSIEGCRGIDCGDLEMSRYVEQITPLLISLNIKYKLKGSGIRITGLRR
ncbi:MAG TPA: NADPH-dependent F420 reductase [Methanothermococcus okinawensis]|uniref:NADPH-dependent F420 reductase n=1 Tax=Methanothermococcus okinawensis TaxID=155863 RepID=A0A833E5X2_9EURY|nr:NADPH-dependent F420 reductase [Methanothermococcus okinawensis]HIP91104.1 NADPH-dependent F420 reductase [Methanothermococcus okinawensis]